MSCKKSYFCAENIHKNVVRSCNCFVFVFIRVCRTAACYNLGHYWFEDYFSLYREYIIENSHIFMINPILNHVAILSRRSLNSMLSLCYGVLPKVVSALFTTLNCMVGGGGRRAEEGTKFVLSMFNNFVANIG